MQISLPLTYRGWDVHYEIVGFGATSQDYDADWMGEESGWQDNGQRVWAPSLPELYYEIDIWIEENAK